MEYYFRLTSYALVTTAFLALALTGQLDAVSVVLYAGAILISFIRDRRRQPVDEQSDEAEPGSRWRAWAWRGLIALYVPFLFFDATLLTNRVLALVHLALFASAAKLLQPKRDRDWVFLYVIAFFMMLLSAGLTFNATFVGSLTLFLFFFVSTLAAFEVRRAQREISAIQDETIAPINPIKRRARPEPTGPRRRVRYLMGASFAQLAVVGVLTLPFFFMIPRFGGGVAQGFADTPATGFSDKVELGQVARIKKSQQVVMRVQLDRNPGRYLRWRGVALDQYENSIWSVSNAQGRDRQVDNMRNFPGGVDPAAPIDWRYQIVSPAAPRESLTEQKIILEPLDTPILFAAQKAIWLNGPMATLHKDIYTNALSTNVIKRRTAYSVWSDLNVPPEPELRAETMNDLPPEVARLYLQLPKEPRRLDPRIRQLAHDITREAGALTPYDKARAIETYLKTRFGYTLDLTINGEDPLAEFLFDVREGHCEYFATAMVVLLRSIGIPARLVNGFQMGEFNDVNRMFTVRQSDAHSWVEVYFPHARTWVEFDPTPAAGINDYSQGGLLARFRKYMDAMEVFWLDYIVTLDSDEQASIIVSMQRRLASVKDRMMDYYNGAKQWTSRMMSFVVARNWQPADWLKLVGLLALLMAIAAAVYVARHLKQWSLAPTGYGPWWHRWFVLPTWKRRRLTGRDGRECAVMFYEQMLAIAARAGRVKPPHQTPMEFADASRSRPIREITALYNRVRFGGAALSETETRRVSQLLAELRRSLTKEKRPEARG